MPDLTTTLDVGDGFVYPRPAALKAAAHLFKAMKALNGRRACPRTWRCSGVEGFTCNALAHFYQCAKASGH